MGVCVNYRLAKWCAYYAETERYDRCICAYRDPQGVARPLTQREYSLCNAYARRVSELLDLGRCRDPEAREALRLPENIQIEIATEAGLWPVKWPEPAMLRAEWRRRLRF